VSEGVKSAKPATPKDSGHLLLRKILIFIAGAAVTAAISWSVNYAATSATAHSGSPVTVSVQADPGQIPFFSTIGQSVVLPNAARNIRGPGGCTGLYPWAKRHGGVPSPAEFQIVVQSETSQAVFISNMRVRVLHRLPKLEGSEVDCQIGGSPEFLPIDINLDREPPRVSYVPANTQFELGHHKTPFGFTLTDGETVIFEVAARTQRTHCVFDIELGVVIGGRTQTIQVTDAGRPFQATAAVPPSRQLSPAGLGA
jgi:hypothetical protein